jgi:hypothetical protein
MSAGRDSKMPVLQRDVRINDRKLGAKFKIFHAVGERTAIRDSDGNPILIDQHVG